jgi:hypothetical protein
MNNTTTHTGGSRLQILRQLRLNHSDQIAFADLAEVLDIGEGLLVTARDHDVEMSAEDATHIAMRSLGSIRWCQFVEDFNNNPKKLRP